MATQNININVNARGIKQTTRQMKGLSGAMERAGRSAGTASVALAAVGAAAAVTARGVVKSADAFTNLTNQTKVFSTSSGQAAFKMQDTINIARKMNSSLTEVGTVYQRISMVQGSIGMSDDTASQMVENLTKAVKLSGATAQEAEGALRQFAQGLAANRFSGQELNSVLEQTPMITQLLAKSLGVGVDKLRGMGEAGELTTEVLVNTFGKAIPDLEEKFRKFSFTIEAQMQSVTREITLFSGMMMHSAGTAESLGGIIDKYITKPLTDMNNTLAKGGPEAAAIMDTVKASILGVTVAVGLLTVAVVALTFTPLVAGFLAVVAAISTAVAFVYKFRNATAEVFGSQISMMDVMVGAWRLAVEGIVGGAQWAYNNFLTSTAAITQAVFDMWNAAMGALSQFGAKVSGTIGAVFTNVMDWTKGLVKSVLDSLSTLLNKIIKISNFVEKMKAGGLSGLTDPTFIAQSWGAAEQGAVDLSSTLKEKVGEVNETLAGLAGGFETAMFSVAGAFETKMIQVKGAMDEAKSSMTTWAEQLAETISGQHDETNAFVPNALIPDGEATDGEDTNADAAGRTLEEIQAAGFMNPQELFASMKAGLNDAKTHIYGFATDIQGTIGGGLAGAFDLVTDSIVELATTGEVSMKKFARAMLKMIQEIIVKLLIQLAIQMAIAALSGGGAAASPTPSPAGGGGGFNLGAPSIAGGINSNLGGISGFASGGPVNGGTPILVGERGPELFVPPQSGSIKNNTTTQGMMQQEAPQVTVVNVDSTQNTLDALGSEDGENIIMNVIQRNPEILRSIG